ncbi:hypothetical protein [Marinitenerispora sediminis]|nr:hypothetical protein [Marinitenerispora sediminis]
MTMMFDVFLHAGQGTRLVGGVISRNDGEIHRGHLPEFGLQLILDAWRSAWVANAPLSPETEAEFAELWGLLLGRDVRVDSAGYLLRDDTLEVREPRARASDVYAGQVVGGGKDERSRYLSLKPDAGEFVRRTSGVIASFDLTDDEAWPDADFELEVTDGRYLAHLSANAWFETAFTGALPYAY